MKRSELQKMMIELADEWERLVDLRKTQPSKELNRKIKRIRAKCETLLHKFLTEKFEEE